MNRNDLELKNDLKQRLSAWMDEEKSDHSPCSDILNDPECLKSFESYHAIRAVLANESSEHWHAGFSEKVLASLADEPTVLAPRHFSTVRKTVTGWAIAASVALAVVLGVQWIPQAPSPGFDGELVAQSETKPTMLAEYHLTEDEKAQLDRIDTIFSQFSQQTNRSSDSALPFVRLVSGERVKTYRMTPQQFRQVMMELELRNKEAQSKAREK